MIEPVNKVSKVPGINSCTDKKADKVLSQSDKAAGFCFKGVETTGDVFVKRQEAELSRANGSESFGDKFIRATKETVAEFESRGIPIWAANPKAMSTKLIDRMEKHGSFGPKKIDYVA